MQNYGQARAQRGADIIRQFRTFSRGIEGARLPREPRHLSKEMSGIIRETFPRQIKLVEKIAPDFGAVVADATQLHQVLVNLWRAAPALSLHWTLVKPPVR